MAWHDRIVVDPKVLTGKPVVRGTWISVELVVDLLAAGMKFLADENFPRPALLALRKVGWDVASIAEECPGLAVEGE